MSGITEIQGMVSATEEKSINIVVLGAGKL
jgi:hypothetical protein